MIICKGHGRFACTQTQASYSRTGTRASINEDLSPVMHWSVDFNVSAGATSRTLPEPAALDSKGLLWVCLPNGAVTGIAMDAGTTMPGGSWPAHGTPGHATVAGLQCALSMRTLMSNLCAADDGGACYSLHVLSLDVRELTHITVA